MSTAILRYGILLAMVSLGTSAATAQTGLYFATGVDSTGWAQAQSNADGQVLIESPEYPRGLWLHLADEAGQALAGLQVEYQGRADSLVAIRCVDPAGLWRETLVWSRPSSDPLRLTLKPREAADLPAGLVPIDWEIDSDAEVLLRPAAEARVEGWGAVEAFLREQLAGRVVVQLDAETSLAVEMDHPEGVETLMAYLQQWHQREGDALGESTALKVQIVEVQIKIFEGNLALLKDVIVHTFLFEFEDSHLERMLQKSFGQSLGHLAQEGIASVTELDLRGSDSGRIRNLAGLEQFAALRWLDLRYNWIADLNPLAKLKNLSNLDLEDNQIADLTPLAQLKDLEWLRLSKNQIVDLNPLAQAQLENLWALYLSNNQIVDLNPLAQAQLENLWALYLSNNQIADLIPLAELKNLETLALSNNQIADLNPLAQLKNLWDLSLGSNQIADLNPLAQLKNLEWLELSNNQIADLTPLAELNNLRVLRLANNQIADLTPLVANTGIGNGDEVNVVGNPLSDQALNEQIPALRARGVTVHY